MHWLFDNFEEDLKQGRELYLENKNKGLAKKLKRAKEKAALKEKAKSKLSKEELKVLGIK